jgi:protein tyrosine kinase modulator
MVLQRELKFEDYVVILRRRKWFLVFPAIALSAGAFAVSSYLPKKYQSETVVLVQQQSVPAAYVPSIVGGDLNERLATMKEQILSRTQLQQIIEKLGLYKEDVGRKPMEELIERLRNSITVSAVRPMAETHANGLPGFTIDVTASQALLAQQICTEITSLFLRQNVVLRANLAEQTTEFLSSQLADAKANLDEQDAKQAEFQRKYAGALPEDAQTNFSLLSSLSSQLNSVNQAIDRAQQDKVFLESNLNAQVNAAKMTESGANPNTLGKQLAGLEDQLTALKARYTDEYPDVIRLKHDIANLQERMKEESAEDTPPRASKTENAAAVPDSAHIQQLRAQIYQLEVTIRERTKEQARIQNQIDEVQSKLQLTPEVQQQYKALTRNYQTALGFYNDLLRKQTDSEMATDLEKRQEGEQFRVLDPPSLPQKPSFPKRPQFAIAGFMGGLALGGLIGFLLELKDSTLRTERDVELILKLPTLATIPTVFVEARNGKSNNGTSIGNMRRESGPLRVDLGA